MIALWLGHESIASTQIYMHADLAVKQRALDRSTPPEVTPNRYRPSVSLRAYLDTLLIMPNGSARGSLRPARTRSHGFILGIITDPA